MLDFRAWIAACIILLLAAGAWVIWITRPRVGYTARSLTAAGYPSNPALKIATKSLHVEGCNEDFIVKPGELVEPRVVPGASIEQFRSVYGKESKPKESKLKETEILSWDPNPYSLTEGESGSGKPENFVRVSVNQGHVVETLDGIDLGIDSFGTIFRKMGDLKVDVHERVEHTDGDWTLIMSFYSACGHKFRSEYSRTLPGNPEIDKQIAPRPTAPGSSTNAAPSLWRSDVFMNKIVSEYTLVPSNGQDDLAEGSPAEHD